MELVPKKIRILDPEAFEIVKIWILNLFSLISGVSLRWTAPQVSGFLESAISRCADSSGTGYSKLRSFILAANRILRQTNRLRGTNFARAHKVFKKFVLETVEKHKVHNWVHNLGTRISHG